MRYALISGTEIEKFNPDVNRMLQAGWELFGTTQIIVIPQSDGRMTIGVGMFYQAMKHMKSVNPNEAQQSPKALIDV